MKDPITTATVDHITTPEIGLSPNPIQAQQNLEITYQSDHQAINIRLYDISGKMLFEKQSFAQNQHHIQLPELAKGTYFVQILDAEKGNRVVEKLVVL